MTLDAGYIRRSSADEKNPGEMSEAVQKDAIRALVSIAGRDPERIVWYRDWNISGGKDDRPDYVRLKADIAARRVGAVYALNLSRIGRSTLELLRFVSLCDEKGVPLRLAKDAIDTSTASGRMLLTILAAVHTFTREVAQEAQNAALVRRRARGDYMGSSKFGFRIVKREDGARVLEREPDDAVAPLLEALDEAGSVAGACRLLNERKVPSPRGRDWHTSAFRRIIDRERPGLLARTKRERGVGAPMLLTGLVRCACGQTMTPNPSRGQFYCLRARIDGEHQGRAYATERLLLPWVKGEADRLLTPAERISRLRGPDPEKQAKVATLQRSIDALRAAGLEESIPALEAQRDALIERPDLEVVSLPDRLDWDADVEVLNAVLRAMWEGVQLDANGKPSRADWKHPEWRREDAA